MILGLIGVTSPGLILLTCIVLGLSLFLFLLMGMDKERARKNLYRIPEKHLLILGLLGGGPGGLLAMRLFRHKTLHWYFWMFFAFGTGIDLLVLYWVWKGGV